MFRKPLCLLPELKKFVFLPHSFRFGADEKLTVITGYLYPSTAIKVAIRARRTKEQTGEPVALIAAYDAERGTMEIICVDANDTQCHIRLKRREERALYRALCATQRKEYRNNNTPTQRLNAIRTSFNLPALPEAYSHRA